MARVAQSLIAALEPHMFSVDAMSNIASIQQASLSTTSEDIADPVKVPTKSAAKNKLIPDNLWVPPYQDKLFWCFYRLFRGEHEYEEARKHSFRVEREAKIAVVEMLRADQELHRGCPFKIKEIEEELVGKKRITHKGLYALCFAHRMSVLYVKDRTYMTIIGEGSATWSGLIVTKEGITGLRKTTDGDVSPSPAEISDVEDKLYWVGNPNKPIKAMSAYGLGDLGKMAERLGIDLSRSDGKKKLKKQLYEEITTYL